jgi:Bax protein
MKKIVFSIVLFFLLFTGNLQAGQGHVQDGNLYLKDYSTAELQTEFQTLMYDRFLNPPNNLYPRFFVLNLPADLDSFENKTFRNQLFMQIVLPIVLKINEEIKEERENLLALQYDFKNNSDLENFECAYLEDLAKKYDVTTPFKDSRRCFVLLSELLRRVDIIPPSLIVAAAAIDTKWGTSRIAVEGNNLFKAKNWYSQDGIKPIGKDADEPYRYVIYDTLEDGIRAYMLKVNSDINYMHFWNARQTARKRKGPLYGLRLVWTFALEHQLKNYAGLLDYTIVFYRMTFFDEAALEKEYDLEN